MISTTDRIWGFLLLLLFIFKKVLFTYLEVRVRGRDLLYVIHSPEVLKGQDRARLKPGSWHLPVSLVHGRGPAAVPGFGRQMEWKWSSRNSSQHLYSMPARQLTPVTCYSFWHTSSMVDLSVSFKIKIC